MSFTPPKRNHYIPMMLLNNFVNDDGHLCVFDKSRSRFYWTNPKNLFVENHLYRQFNFDTKCYDYGSETTLSDIESKAAPVIGHIMERARDGKFPALSPQQKYTWNQFYHASCRRNPVISEEVLKLEEHFEGIFHVEVERIFLQGGMLPIDRNSLDRNPEIAAAKVRMKRNAKARFASGSHPNLQAQANRFSLDSGLKIAVIYRTKRSFVVGSHGIAIVKSTKRKKAAFGSWLPIAYDVVVAPTSFPDREILLRLDSGRDWIIKEINRASFQQSQIVAGRSESLIKSLAKF